jgi:hypothetical protein
MKVRASVVLLVAIVGVGGIGSTAYSVRAADRDNREVKHENREYRAALQNLKDAREILATADGNWEGRRREALTQTDYAIEQVYANLGDDPAKYRDQKTAARELEEGREKRADSDDRDSVERRHRQMHSAIDQLRAGREQLTKNDADDLHRRKALTFVDEAIKDIQLALTRPH